jgi:hypothetical protein
MQETNVFPIDIDLIVHRTNMNDNDDDDDDDRDEPVEDMTEQLTRRTSSNEPFDEE